MFWIRSNCTEAVRNSKSEGHQIKFLRPRCSLSKASRQQIQTLARPTRDYNFLEPKRSQGEFFTRLPQGKAPDRVFVSYSPPSILYLVVLTDS
jgi:hypothetical protein